MSDTAMSKQSLHDSINRASEFFSSIKRPEGSKSTELSQPLGAPTLAANPESVFTTSTDGLVSCLLAEPTVDDDLQVELDQQKQNLINLVGVASAYVRKKATEQNNPNLVYNTDIWQLVFNNLPLMGPSQFTMQTFSESIRGIDIAVKFLEVIIGVAAGGGAALTGFIQFIRSQGDQIRLGVESGHQTQSAVNVAILLQTQKIGNVVELIPMLRGYFVNFDQSQNKVYGFCFSADSFNVNFGYRNADSVFNYKALEDPEVSAAFDKFIKGTQLDDIRNATNFFPGKY